MKYLLLCYFIGCLATTNLMLVWRATRFPVHLFCREDEEDLKNYWQFKLGFFGELFSCTICLSHWFSLLVAVIIFFIFSMPWWFILAGVFTWPLLCFIILKKIGIV